MKYFSICVFLLVFFLEVKLSNPLVHSTSVNRCTVEHSSRRILRRTISPSVVFDENQKTLKWSSQNVTYRISDYTNQLTKEFVDEQVERAFELWAEHTDLIFIRKNGTEEADIEIKFGRGSHGDSSPFRSFDIAHAFAPDEGIGGDIHLNDNYTHWAVGTTFLHSMTHEIGHAIGLNHVPLKYSVMSPYQGHAEFPVSLALEDVQAVQALYGKKKATCRQQPKKLAPSIILEAVKARERPKVTTNSPKIFVEKDTTEDRMSPKNRNRTKQGSLNDVGGILSFSTTLPATLMPTSVETVTITLSTEENQGKPPPDDDTEGSGDIEISNLDIDDELSENKLHSSDDGSGESGEKVIKSIESDIIFDNAPDTTPNGEEVLTKTGDTIMVGRGNTAPVSCPRIWYLFMVIVSLLHVLEMKF